MFVVRFAFVFAIFYASCLKSEIVGLGFGFAFSFFGTRLRHDNKIFL
jgi:hypothetical protein